MKFIKKLALGIAMISSTWGLVMSSTVQASADQVGQPVVVTPVQGADSLTTSNNLTNQSSALTEQQVLETKMAGQQGFYNGVDGYPINQCTGFVAGILRHQQIPANLYAYLGNGDQWATNAQKRGLQVDLQPRVGSVVSFKSMHVAYVTQVHPNGTFDIIEGNFEGQSLHERTMSITDDVAGFIHFENELAPVQINASV
ncbi:MAG TPA: hypothetical protein DCW31_09460 [Lactobacillus sp.]|nr:hypothetical protein [Lactobacillus sp.]